MRIDVLWSIHIRFIRTIMSHDTVLSLSTLSALAACPVLRHPFVSFAAISRDAFNNDSSLPEKGRKETA